MKTDGPLPENVDKWRTEGKNSFETQLKTNGFWLGYIGGQLQNNEDLDQVKRYNNLLDDVTPADLKEMADKYLTGDNYIRLALLPETSLKGK